jgi:hypothetical protein
MGQATQQSPTIGWDLDAERSLWRAICAPNSWFGPDNVTPATHPRALWYFITKAWGAEEFLKRHPEHPQWLYEPIHVPYTEWLQLHLLRWKEWSRTGQPGRYYIASVLPRGYGKTVCSTKAASLWTHLDEPDMSTLIGTSTGPLSEDILEAISSVMSGGDGWFGWLYGNWRKGAKKWKPREIINHGYRDAGNLGESSFDITSIGVGMTGYHHRQHWWDDPIYKNKLKEDKLAYMRSVHDGVNASWNALQANGLIAFTLTRYLDDDVAGRHFKEEGIASWSGMECPHMAACTEKVTWGEGQWHVFYYQTEDELTGAPTNPRLWTRAMIAEAKRRDSDDFACQQQNNPGAGERAPLIESQLPHLYLSYLDFYWDVSEVEWATIHIDTAFKRLDNIRTGDDNAIVVWLKAPRDDGILYLDTHLLQFSNEWREEEFNKALIATCLNLRRRRIHIRAITDETEPGGKAGTYKNRILGILRSAGFMLGDEQFIQLNRRIDKRSRIRTGVGHWAEGYARVLLDRDGENNWILPKGVRKLFGQILKPGASGHDDLADAATDGFISQLWTPPMSNPGIPADEGARVKRPWDDDLKDVGKPMSNEELFAMIDERDQMRAAGYLEDGVRGNWNDDGDGWVPPREPV